MYASSSSMWWKRIVRSICSYVSGLLLLSREEARAIGFSSLKHTPLTFPRIVLSVSYRISDFISI